MALEKYTVAAQDAEGNTLAEIDFIGYDVTTWKLLYTVEYEGEIYCIFDYALAQGKETLGEYPYQICVWRVGDEVSNFYYVGEWLNMSEASAAESIYNYYQNAEGMTLVKDHSFPAESF